jgi:hypothetical protein
MTVTHCEACPAWVIDYDENMKAVGFCQAVKPTKKIESKDIPTWCPLPLPQEVKRGTKTS